MRDSGEEESARRERQLADYDRVVASVAGKVKVGRKLTREEMNDR